MKMTPSRIRRLGTAPTLLCLVLVPLAVAAQEDSSFEPHRTSWGTPDISGVWDFRTLTPLERPAVFADKAVLTPEEAQAYRDQALKLLDVDNRVDDSKVDVEGAYNTFWWDWGTELEADLRTSLIVDPPDGRLPALTKAAAERLKEQNLLRTLPVRDLFSYSADPTSFLPEGPESVGLSERCLVGFNAGPPLIPSAYNNNVRILQTKDAIVLVTEMIHDARVVRMDGADPLPDEIERWSGESRGQWEGNTLVVETTNFSDKRPSYQIPADGLDFEQALTVGGAGSGKTLHLVERFTRVAENRLRYEYTVTDEATFELPFTVRFDLRPATEPMFEYACHEGNYAMEGMLRGARLLEKEQAEAGAGQR